MFAEGRVRMGARRAAEEEQGSECARAAPGEE